MTEIDKDKDSPGWVSPNHPFPTILFVTYGWRETGGGTIFPRAVACELGQRGYRIAVMYASLDRDPSQPACALRFHEEDGIRLYGVINRPALFIDPDNPEREIDSPDVRRAYCQVLDKVKPGIVHFHNFHGLSFSLAEETHRRNIFACFTPHNYHLIDPELYLLKNGLVCWNTVDPMTESEAVHRNPQLEGWYRKRIETTLRLMNKWIGITLAVSKRQRELLIRYGGDPRRIAVIHQISPAAAGLWQNPVVATARKRTIQRPLQVGYIGGLIPIKGVQMLVAAAQVFTPDQLQVHLYGFSVRDYEENLRLADTKGIVTFHGAYLPEDLPRLAEQIDLAVIPSLVEESAPTLVLSELFAMGIPVIAADIGGIPEFIAEGVDGALYQPYDLEALVGHLKKYVNKPELLADMRRNLNAPTHTFERYMEQLEMLYREIMTGEQIDADRISFIAAKRRAAPVATSHSPYISWHGGLFVHHSLALVNRELCLQLLERGLEISFSPSQPDEFNASIDPRFNRLEACRHRPLKQIDVTVRHQWPPDFSRPPQGKLIVVQPWEYGSIPSAWVSRINAAVDELWVPSTFVRDCYLQGGVDADRVQVIPNGVATDRLHPGIPPGTLATQKRFRFLFVGGTIRRKGIDLLLASYSAAFTADDDVCLVIKDMGGSTIYQGQTAGEMIAAFQRVPGHPELLYLEDMYDNDQMASLYTACQCLVHPYRGEGFGLPIAEAMACGLAPIVTGYGAALDFCPPEIAWLIPATVKRLPTRQVGSLETVDFPWLAEPDCDVLTSLMRHAFDHSDEVKQRGKSACHFIQEHFTWAHVARIADERLRQLVQQAAGRGEADAISSASASAKESKLDNAAATTAYVVENEGAVRKQLLQDVCGRGERLALRGEVEASVMLLLNQGIRADAASPLPYLLLVKILMSAGRFQDALGVASEMPTVTNPGLIHEIEARCNCALGDDTRSQRAAELAGDQYPHALVVLGTLAARRGDIAAGEQLFRQAIAVDSECGDAWLSLGMILWSLGEQQDAWMVVCRAVEVDPLNDEAIKIVRDMAKKMGFDALKLVEAAAGRYPDSIKLARHHTEQLAECGNDTAALAVCERFLAHFGVDDRIIELGLALRQRLGRHERFAEGSNSSVSLCMIVKNEEGCLARCLASVKPLVDEMVVVDTGSDDRTVAVATLYGAEIYRFDWNGSFSDARNYALGKASGAWILTMDADERIAAQDHAAFSQMVLSSSPDKDAWSVLIRNYSQRVHIQGWQANDGTCPEEEQGDGWYPATRVRLFPRDLRVRYEGVVHELVEPSLRANDFVIHTAPFVVHHYGEVAGLPTNLLEKQRRYFELGKQKLVERPDDPVAVAELAVQAGELGLFNEALELWDRLLGMRPDTVEAFFGKGHALINLKRYAEALEVSLRALQLDPAHREAAFNYGTCELYVGDPARALPEIERLLKQVGQHPLLQALMVMLSLALGRYDQATAAYASLTAMNYAFGDYLRDRLFRLQAIGRTELAQTIAVNAAKIGIKQEKSVTSHCDNINQ